MILYRGVNHKLHNYQSELLIPKESGPFVKPLEFGEAEWGNSFWGTNEENAVVRHQLHQSGYATCGISTTPIYERAIFYATHNGTYSKGFVYEIDSKVCDQLEVRIFDVSKIVPSPSIPEDSEFILVAKEYGNLPKEIVTKIHEFET